MKPQSWSPSQYLRFEDQRTRPARDLLAQVRVDAPEQVVDVGCGPGNSTALLVERWPGASVTGIDTSEAMLTEARRRLPAATFSLADASTWTPPPATDVVFANAVYQWVPGHIAQFSRILEAMGQGGVLAVQMPDNLMQPMHVLMRETAGRMPFAARLVDAARAPLPGPGVYYDALAASTRRLDIWHTEYNHIMKGAEAIVDWVKGTGLGPFLERLDPAEQESFLAAYTDAIRGAYPASADGRVLMSFRRFFIIAER